MIESYKQAHQKLDEKDPFQYKKNKIYQKIEQTKSKWIKVLEQSSKIWTNFMHLKIQTTINDLKTNNNSKQIEEYNIFERNFDCLIKQTQNCVIKGLKNIEKLYMTPELREKQVIKQKENVFSLQQKPRSLSKNRSSSVSSSKNSKSYLFQTGIIKHQKKHSYYLKSQSSSIAFNFVRNFGPKSNIVKHQKQKNQSNHQNKFDSTKNFGQTIVSKIPIETRQDFSKKKELQQLSSSISQYFFDKQQKKQNKLVEKVTNNIQHKLKNVSDDLNTKINLIIENLTSIKNSHHLKDCQNKDQRVGGPSVNQKINNQEYQQKQPVKPGKLIQKAYLIERRESSINRTNSKLIENPIVQDKYQNFEESIQQLNYQISEDDKIRQINTLQIQEDQKKLQQFINQTKKVKLPISQQLKNIFINFYVHKCKCKKIIPNLSKFSFKNQLLKQIQSNEQKQQLKQLVTKLKKLITMENLKKDLAQKLNFYITSCLTCIYRVVLHQNHQISSQIVPQMDKIVQKL